MRAGGFSVRVSFFYVAFFLLFGVQLPFFPVWLQSRGLDAGQIGLVSALPLLVRIFAVPVVTAAADRLGRSGPLIGACIAMTFASLVGLLFAFEFKAIVGLAILFAVAFTPLLPLMDALATSGHRRGEAEYGRMRLWGSVSFILASLVGGTALEAYSPDAVIWLLLGSTLLTGLAAIFLPSTATAADAATPRTSLLSDGASLLLAPSFLLFLLASGLSMSSHAVLYTLGSVHWKHVGFDDGLIGTLWAVGVCAEIVLFALTGSLLRGTTGPALILAGAIGGIVRWIVTAFDPPLAILFPMQILHAATFGLTHLGAMMFLQAAVPERLSRLGQGLYASLASGVFMSTAMYASGYLYETFSGRAYLFMAGMSLAAMLAALALRRSWHGETLAARN